MTETTFAKREAMIPREARQKLRQRALDHNSTMSEELALLVEDYAEGQLSLAEDPGPVDTVRVRFAIPAEAWRKARSRTIEEETNISTIIRRAVAAL